MRRFQLALLVFSLAGVTACGDDDHGHEHAPDSSYDTSSDTGADVGIGDVSSPDAVVVSIAPNDFWFSAPENGATVDAANVDVTVAWESGDVNGIAYAIHGADSGDAIGPFDSPEFTFNAALEEGVNRIEVTLVRGDDSTLVRELVVLREGAAVEPPSLSIDSPTDGTVVDGDTATVTVSWTGEGASSLHYALNGGDAVDTEASLEVGTATFDVPVAVGVHTVYVTIAFEDGTTVGQTLVLVRDLPDGAVVITAPRELETDGAVAHVAGVIVGAEPTEVVVTHGSGDETALVQAVGDTWEFYAAVPLELDDNVLTATASFEDVDSASTSITVTRVADETAPVFEWVTPTDGHDVRSVRPFVRAGLTDNVAVTEATVVVGDGEPIALDFADGVATGYVTLDRGENALVFSASDAAGNTTTWEQTLYLGHRVASGGAHGGAIADGALFVWGRNNIGQVGIGRTSTLSGATDEEPHTTAPHAIAGDTTFVSIAFAQNVSIALDDAGQVWAWGDNGDGQLGVGTAATDDEFDEEDRYSPTPVTGLTDVVTISRAYDHTLALDASGQLWVWGDNVDGQLGVDPETLEASDVPLAVAGIDDAVAILGASASTYVIREDGTLWSFGENTYGNLGLGNADDDAHPTPTQVPGLAGVIDIAAGRDHVLALTETGEVYTWGLNRSLQAHPDGEDRSTPTLREDISGMVAVYASGNQSFTEDADGLVYGWGQDINGNLGRISDEEAVAPTEPVFGVSDSISVGIGALQGLVTRRDGRIFSWGWSFEGSLGGGDSIINRWAYRVPILVELPTD